MLGNNPRKYLQKINAISCAFFPHLIGPDGYLNLSDMSLAEIKHTDTGLADTAAHGVGQLLLQNGLLEGQLRPILAAGEFQLTGKGILVHADTHGGQLQGVAQNRIPHDDIAV